MVECPHCNFINRNQPVVDNHVSDLHLNESGTLISSTVISKAANRRVGDLNEYFEINGLQNHWQSLAASGAVQELYDNGHTPEFDTRIDAIVGLTPEQKLEIRSLFP